MATGPWSAIEGVGDRLRRGSRRLRATRRSASRCPRGSARGGAGRRTRSTRVRWRPARRAPAAKSTQRSHRLELVGEDVGVAGRAVELPRHVHGGVAPAGRALGDAARTPAVGRRRAGSGTMLVTAPSGRCSAARSRSHFAEKSRRRRGTRRSRRRSASRRSSPERSRVGQSVGRSQALPRKLQSATRWRRLMRSSEHAKPPIASRSVWTTTLVIARRSSGAGVAFDAHVLEALGAVARLEHVAVAGGDDDVGLERHGPRVERRTSRARCCSCVTSPSGSSHSP